MNRKKLYVRPAVLIVEMRTGGRLLEDSLEGTLVQYDYEEEDGWTDD